jgi:cobyrinic acid a,c-diamide synthase
LKIFSQKNWQKSWRFQLQKWVVTLFNVATTFPTQTPHENSSKPPKVVVIALAGGASFSFVYEEL